GNARRAGGGVSSLLSSSPSRNFFTYARTSEWKNPLPCGPSGRCGPKIAEGYDSFFFFSPLPLPFPLAASLTCAVSTWGTPRVPPIGGGGCWTWPTDIANPSKHDSIIEPSSMSRKHPWRPATRAFIHAPNAEAQPKDCVIEPWSRECMPDQIGGWVLNLSSPLQSLLS